MFRIIKSFEFYLELNEIHREEFYDFSCLGFCGFCYPLSINIIEIVGGFHSKIFRLNSRFLNFFSKLFKFHETKFTKSFNKFSSLPHCLR